MLLCLSNPCMSFQPSTIAEFTQHPETIGLDVGKLAIVSLGANLPLGDRTPRQTLTLAMQRIARISDYPLVVSPMLETVPVNCPAGSPAYLNALLAFYPRSGATPETTLAQLQVIEAELGRVRTGLQNEPRVIDLDLIAFGQALRQTPNLQLPHPRAGVREFVLAPLLAIWPDYRFPNTQESAREMLVKWHGSA
jgi:2-amino-4-hydroxy-6-hydroxymethyldihydropteridine diphosphokinase